MNEAHELGRVFKIESMDEVNEAHELEQMLWML